MITSRALGTRALNCENVSTASIGANKVLSAYTARAGRLLCSSNDHHVHTSCNSEARQNIFQAICPQSR